MKSNLDGFVSVGREVDGGDGQLPVADVLVDLALLRALVDADVVVHRSGL